MSNGQQNKASFKDYVIAAIALIFVVLIYFATCGDSGSSSSSSSSKKNGFVGSDGKYHAYVPEFGNDVNSWMEENW